MKRIFTFAIIAFTAVAMVSCGGETTKSCEEEPTLETAIEQVESISTDVVEESVEDVKNENEIESVAKEVKSAYKVAAKEMKSELEAAAKKMGAELGVASEEIEAAAEIAQKEIEAAAEEVKAEAKKALEEATKSPEAQAAKDLLKSLF